MIYLSRRTLKDVDTEVHATGVMVIVELPLLIPPVFEVAVIIRLEPGTFAGTVSVTALP